MKRILHHYHSSAFDTGSPKALAQFIDVTDRSRFEPVFVANRRGPLLDALRARDVRIIEDPVSSLGLRHPVRGLKGLAHKVALLRELRPDLVHRTGFGWNDDLVVAAGLLRIPVALHVHVPEQAARQNMNRVAADRVLFCSDYERRNFRHPERIEGKAQVLYNVINVEPFSRALPDRARFGLRDDDVVIVSVSQLSHRKGLDIALEAARIVLAAHPEVVFVHAGPDAKDEPAYGETIRSEAAADPRLGDRFRFLGSRQDIPELMASSDIFLLASRAEPFGLVVGEAMSARLPVVVSNVGGIPEAVGVKENGCLVSPIEPSAFAAAIESVLALPDRGRAMGVRAAQSVRERFSGEVIGRQLNAIYDSLL